MRYIVFINSIYLRRHPPLPIVTYSVDLLQVDIDHLQLSSILQSTLLLLLLHLHLQTTWTGHDTICTFTVVNYLDHYTIHLPLLVCLIIIVASKLRYPSLKAQHPTSPSHHQRHSHTHTVYIHTHLLASPTQPCTVTPPQQPIST